ncbi:hypothetical protein WJX84_007651 [Apatococcus fuscideae]|uniref:Uncharacterized protein n=1 Tax=Apatococcus fuscideae TaxID=2026836 RepID=A0AAW1T603_9CHLO
MTIHGHTSLCLLQPSHPLRRSCSLVPTALSRPRHAWCRKPRHITTAEAKNDINKQLSGLARTGNRAVDSAASFLPATVPKPFGKAGIYGVVGIVGFWLLNKVISTVVTFALLGAAAVIAFRAAERSTSSDRDAGSGSSKSSSEDPDDPLAAARRIMDKYK